MEGAGFTGSWPEVQRTLVMEPLTKSASAMAFGPSGVEMNFRCLESQWPPISLLERFNCEHSIDWKSQ